MARRKIKDPRRVNDYWSRKAKSDRYPARSVYKLEEADRKHKLFGSGQTVIDLGCSPGSWTLYAAQKVGPKGKVVGVDLQKIDRPPAENVVIIQADVLTMTKEDFLDYRPADVVLSDMAPKTTGVKSVDQARSTELCRAAIRLARSLLRPGGRLMFKVFQGPDTDELVREVATIFDKVHRIKPKSSRSFSPEIFILGTGFRYE